MTAYILWGFLPIRIAALEKALSIEAEKNAAALAMVAKQFRDDGGDDDEMERLNAMAERHRKDMEKRNVG